MPAPYLDIYYKTHDGLTLYARDYPHTDADVTVLCLHGLTRNSADFESIAAHLNDRFRVVVLEQRGRGRSDYDTNSSNYELPVYCMDTMGFITAHIDGPIAVLGTSMGGLMAMAMSAAKPGQFTGVVLNDIGPVIDTEGLEKIKGYIGSGAEFESFEMAGQLFSMIGATAFPKYDAGDWLKFAKRACKTLPNGKVTTAYDPKIADPIKAQDDALSTPDLWPMYESLKGTPVLILRGELSDLFSAATAGEMIARHDQATEVVIRDVGHAPMLDEPDSAAAIDAFLGGLSAV